MNKNIFTKNKTNYQGTDISRKISYTNMVECIPEGSFDRQLPNWQNSKNTEWRWRFLKIPQLVVEISFMKNTDQQRTYFNKFGQEVHREIPNEYDAFVVQEYYYYT